MVIVPSWFPGARLLSQGSLLQCVQVGSPCLTDTSAVPVPVKGLAWSQHSMNEKRRKKKRLRDKEREKTWRWEQ